MKESEVRDLFERQSIGSETLGKSFFVLLTSFLSSLYAFMVFMPSHRDFALPMFPVILFHAYDKFSWKLP